MSYSTILQEAASFASGHPNASFAAVGQQAQSFVGRERAREANVCRVPGGVAALPTSVAPSSRTLVEAVRSGIDDLTWWEPETVSPDVGPPSAFIAASAVAELVGPNGAIESAALRFGLFFIGQDVEYERHWHAANEIYAVLAGEAQWCVDEHWSSRPPGEAIEIPSMAPHSIQTGDSAVLMLYSWTGDITFDTYEIERSI